MSPHDLLIYAHIGDLHLTDPAGDHYRDFAAIVTEIGRNFGKGLDFVYLPGDNADNGLPEQYALVRRELARLPVPVHIVTGDHDMEPGNLENFYRELGADPLPKAVEVGGTRCLFLDICGPGSGGQDFRLGEVQSKWLASELAKAAENGARCAIFMHSYPADLKESKEARWINQAFAAREVLLVDMGHTHYNELANDGRTIFAATRSTGQIEEGGVGYSIVTIDRRTVSWRFRELGDTAPAVLITAPADRRLAIDPEDRDHHPRSVCELRVSILGPHPIVRCACRLDGGAPRPLMQIGETRYTLDVALGQGARTILVEVEDATGAVGRESIELSSDHDFEVERHADGSDADRIGAWEARGILGTQLGPNRNGRHW